MRYRFIRDHADRFRVGKMCLVLSVSRSGYYAWRKRPESARTRQNRRLIFEMSVIDREVRHTYGSPRMHRELSARGFICSLGRVERLMRAAGLQARQSRRFRPMTTDSAHGLAVAPNLLQRCFRAEAPNRVWVADISYIPTAEGWLYLAVVLDLFSRRVAGWSTGSDLSRHLPLRALRMALEQRRPAAGLIHHSDRGKQYASDDYQDLLDEKDMICSMSRTGNCYDNAAAESFFSSLKRERVQFMKYPNRHVAAMDLFDYIELFYNRKRLHSTIDYRTPVQVEKEWNVA